MGNSIFGRGISGEPEEKQEKLERNLVEISLSSPPQETPVPVEKLKSITKSICSISNNEKSINCNALMVKIDSRAHGLLFHATSNVIASNPAIHVVFDQLGSEGVVGGCVVGVNTHNFHFYCPLAEVIFFKFKDEIVTNLLGYGCEFIDLSTAQTEEKPQDDTKVYVCNPLKRNQVVVSCGVLKEHYGLDIRHDALCNSDSIGSPLFTESGRLIGIQKTVTDNQSTNNLAISIATLMETHFQHLFPSELSHENSITTNPVNITSEYGDKLSENGLEKCTVSSIPKYSSCNFYVSPESPYVTPIWFMPTVMGWYWTPTDLHSGSANWMPISVLAVVGGSWHGEIPASKNVTVIRWLQKNNIEK